LAVLVTAMLTSACGGRGVHSYVDPFDGPTRGFSLVPVLWGDVGLEAHEAHGGVELQVAVLANGELGDVAPAGTPVEFRIGGQTRVLWSVAAATPVSSIDDLQVVTEWRVSLFLTRAQIAWFAEAPLTAFRVAVGARQYTIPLTSRDARQVQQNMRTLCTMERGR
jgi:hypothetical protein